jgi:hypothetical protein
MLNISVKLLHCKILSGKQSKRLPRFLLWHVHFCLDPAWSAQKRTAAADRQKSQVAQTGWSPPAVATAGKIQSGASQASTL